MHLFIVTLENGSSAQFTNKQAAKDYRTTHGGIISRGPDHIGPHGHNKVTQHMKNKRDKRV